MTPLIDVPHDTFGLKPRDAVLKRGFDIVAAGLGLITLWWLIGLLALIARFDTGLTGFYAQTRVGLFGKAFTLYKLRSMRNIPGLDTTVTREQDPRITSFGRLLRRTKLDELPQLWNILTGDMSFVGPRPDVADTYRELTGEDLRILTIRPGVTGPASIHFRNEERQLDGVADPEAFNRNVIFPEKVSMNLRYIENFSLLRDIRYIFLTLIPTSDDSSDATTKAMK